MNIFSQNKHLIIIDIALFAASVVILTGIIVLAVNPNLQPQQSRNAERAEDVQLMLDGIYDYALANNGLFPSSIEIIPGEVCAQEPCDELVDLSMLLDPVTYITEIPRDPQCPKKCAENGTGYTVFLNDTGRVTVSAPLAEGQQLSVSR